MYQKIRPFINHVEHTRLFTNFLNYYHFWELLGPFQNITTFDDYCVLIKIFRTIWNSLNYQELFSLFRAPYIVKRDSQMMRRVQYLVKGGWVFPNDSLTGGRSQKRILQWLVANRHESWLPVKGRTKRPCYDMKVKVRLWQIPRGSFLNDAWLLQTLKYLKSFQVSRTSSINENFPNIRYPSNYPNRSQQKSSIN